MDELENLLNNYKKADSIQDVPTHKLFEIAKFNHIIEEANREQAINLAKDIYKLMIIREHSMNELLKHKWFTDNSDYNIAA